MYISVKEAVSFLLEWSLAKGMAKGGKTFQLSSLKIKYQKLKLAHVYLGCIVRKYTFGHVPVHLHSLIRIFTGHILDSQGCKVSSCGQ